MNIVRHHIKKDVRHLRIPLAIWFLLVALQAALSGSGITAGAQDMVLAAAFQVLSFVVPLLQALILIVLIPLLVHDEPLVGSTAFWFTRPIARRDLLSSKAMFVGLLIVLPALLAELMVLAFNGIAVRHVLLSIPEILIERLSLLLLVAMVAVLTPSFARFALVGAGCWVAVMLITLVIYFTRMFINPESMLCQEAQFSLTASRGVITSILTIALGLAVVWYQYLTRKTKRSILVAALGYLLVTTVQFAWPWDFMAAEKKMASKDLINGDGVTLSVNPGQISVSDEFRLRRGKAAKKQIQSLIEVDGLPAGYVAEPEVTASTITLPNGKVIKNDKPSFSYSFSSRWDPHALQHTLGKMDLIAEDDNSFTYRSLASIDEEDYFACGEAGVDLSLTFDLNVYRYEIAGAMPLTRGARHDRGSEQTLITDVLRQSQGCTVAVREKKVRLLFAPECREMPGSQLRVKVQYVLCNRKRNEAFLPQEEPHEVFDVLSSQNRLSIENRTLHFVGGNSFISPKIDVKWLADAELLRVEKVDVGHLTKPLVIKSLILKDEARMRHFSGSSGSSKQKDGPDEDALRQITLPDNPTKEQANTYVMKIIEASRGQRSFSPEDPQVAMLKRVGPTNLDVLLNTRGEMLYHITYAVKNLVGPQHKDLILKNLERWPDLAGVVLSQGWAKDARDTLLSGLKTVKYVPTEWIQAIVSLNDPSTYENLTAFLAKGNSPRQTYEILKRVPGIDLSAAVAEAWHRTRYKALDYEALQMVSAAIEYGHIDALDVGTEYMTRPGSETQRYDFQINETVRAYVDTTGSGQDIRDWFVKNKNSLFFDAETRKFKVKQ